MEKRSSYEQEIKILDDFYNENLTIENSMNLMETNSWKLKTVFNQFKKVNSILLNLLHNCSESKFSIDTPIEDSLILWIKRQID